MCLSLVFVGMILKTQDHRDRYWDLSHLHLYKRHLWVLYESVIEHSNTKKGFKNMFELNTFH